MFHHCYTYNDTLQNALTNTSGCGSFIHLKGLQVKHIYSGDTVKAQMPTNPAGFMFAHSLLNMFIKKLTPDQETKIVTSSGGFHVNSVFIYTKL